MLISLKRVISNGWKSFSRNISLSLGTIFIMVIVIFLPTFLFLLRPASKALISGIEEKVDISLYFNEDAKPEDVSLVKSAVSKIPEVKEVEYISKEQALDRFVERHKNDPVLMESLKEVGNNPFLSSLDIKAWQVSQYGQIVKFLETSPFNSLINKIDYSQRKIIIEKIFSTISAVNKAGILFALILGIIAILIAFNAVRAAIDDSKEEIKIMRLVGASNWFIRGPFLIQGVIIGFIAALITFLIAFGACWALDSKIKLITPGISVFNLFVSNIGVLILIQLVTGIGLGVVSSIIAIKKYLKV